MNVEWQGKKCILCIQELPLTSEHIIPQSIGGALTCSFLCKACNSYLGARVEGKVRNDPTIRLSTDNLRVVAPEVADKIEEGLAFIIHSNSGAAPAVKKKGTVQVVSRKASDGSLFQSVPLARSTLANMLRKDKVPENAIQTALEAQDKSGLDKRVEVHPGYEVITWESKRVERDLSKATFMNLLVPLKIAYEFVACHLGTSIFDDVWEEIRHALLGDMDMPQTVRITRAVSRKFSPVHGVCNEGNNPHCSILMRLLSTLQFRVEFLNIAVLGPAFVYTHNLAEETENVTELPK